MNYINTLLFGYYPYVAAVVLVLGSYLRIKRNPYSVRTSSSQLLRGKWVRFGSPLFHIGLLAILGGHVIGLLTPHHLYEAMGLTSSVKQMAAIVFGGMFGLVCMIGLIALLYRRIMDARVRATGSRMDLIILVLIGVQLTLGLMTLPVSLTHSDGSQMLLLAAWAQHIVTFRAGAADLILNAHWIFKAHILVGLTLLFFLPFSRLIHVCAVPLTYVFRSYQIIRRR